LPACRNVRTKQTKQTKSSVGTAFPSKRDDLSAFELRIGERPVVSSAPFLSSLGWPRAGIRWCGFSKLSKMLIQEHALSAPCSMVLISALRGRTDATDKRNPSLRLSLYRCYTQVIMPTSNDAFPVVGGRCTGKAHRCKARQGRRGKTAPTLVLNLTVVRLMDGIKRRRRFLW
jgi:hypothetical protein